MNAHIAYKGFKHNVFEIASGGLNEVTYFFIEKRGDMFILKKCASFFAKIF
jgi:hypothetical protein